MVYGTIRHKIMRQVTLPPENYARGYKAPVKSIELCEGLQNYATGYKIMRDSEKL